MHIYRAEIEIAPSPEVVRAKFLDLQQLPKYHKDGFWNSITPKNSSKPLEIGDIIINDMIIGKFEAPTLENTPHVFKWVGGVSGVFVGNHAFRFEPSTKNPGGTLFVQEEDFHGAFSFIMGDNAAAKWVGWRPKTAWGWDKFNKDLKAWVESTS